MSLTEPKAPRSSTAANTPATLSAIPDDHPNDTSTLGQIAVGHGTAATFSFPADSDWFRIQLTAGLQYLVTAQGGGTPPPQLNLYNDRGEPFSGSTGFPVEGVGRMTVGVPTSGIYYVGVGNQSGSSAAYTVGLDLFSGRYNDFNDDRTSDLLLLNGRFLTSWFLQDGRVAGATTIASNLAGGTLVPGTGDFNRDGLSDILIQNGNTVAELFLDANGQFAGGNVIDPFIIDSGGPGFGPLYRSFPDGGMVIGTLNSDAFIFRSGSSLFVWNLGTDGEPLPFVGETSVTNGPLAPEWQVVGIGDFNRDGNSDLLLQNASTVVEWFLNERGSYVGGEVLTTALPFGWMVTGTGDFNGDQTSDILVRGGNYVVDWIMQGGQVVGGNVLANALPPGWSVTGTGAYDRDGTTDISLQGGGTVVNWLMQDGSYAGGNVLATNLPSGWSVVGKT